MRRAVAHCVAPLIAMAAFISSATMHAQPARTDAARLYQGGDWTDARRQDFYTGDQGSRIMPLAWFRALRHDDGTGFLDDDLERYGYLPNPAGPDRLPVGFTVDTDRPNRAIGMTCAACHTRELEADGIRYRVDGAPAIVDFQALLTDIDHAVGRVTTERVAFAAFDRAVHSADPGAPSGEALRTSVAAWYLRYHTLMQRALPSPGWGLGRLDAVSMIFNRLSGLDIGPPPSFLLPDNIARADAPVRYPFIWDAPRQDHTQWPGFASNGDELLGLARNLGEVYGVFGTFYPHKSGRFLLGYDFVTDNSANFHGLRRMEGLLRRMKAPVWPWAIDAGLRSRGEAIFNRSVEDGGCQSCHGQRRGALRLVPLSTTWRTPLVDVGTDTREYAVVNRVAATGALTGALKPSLTRLQPVDRSIDILATAVIGAILQNDFALVRGRSIVTDDRLASVVSPVRGELRGAFNLPPTSADQPHRYEARVLHGIWATAPYLHNGSVPTLRDLLTEPDRRPREFMVGRSYDRAAVGLSRTQTGLAQRRSTTGCDRLDSGESRCGHDYGTRLTDDEKRALLEYLKTL